MFACRSGASTKSDVESSTIAVVVRVSSTAGSLVARGSVALPPAAARIASASRSTGPPFSTTATAPASRIAARSSAVASAREADDRRAAGRADGPGRRGAVQAGEAVVHQHDGRRELGGRPGRVGAARDGPHDLESRLESEEELERGAVDLVVLDEEDSDRAHSAERRSG